MGNGHSSSKKNSRKGSRKNSRREPTRDSKKSGSTKDSSRRDHKKDSKSTSSRQEPSRHHRHSHHAPSNSHSNSHSNHAQETSRNNHRNTIHMANDLDGPQTYAQQRMDFILQLFQDHSFVPQIHPLWERMGENARSASIKVRDRGAAVTAPERDDFVRLLYTEAPEAPEAPEAMGYGYDVEDDRLYSREASPVVNALGIMDNEPPSDQGSVRPQSMFQPSSVYSTDVESAPRSRRRSLSPLIPEADAFPPPAPAPERAPPIEQPASRDHHRDRHSRSHAGPSSEGDRHHRHGSHSHSRSHARESSRERARRRPQKKSSSSSRRK